MVHAYLMYGFPTQTAQETIDSLEMVRQMFEAGILQSAFWHRFAMTAHSPVGLNPEKYSVQKVSDSIGTFANNDVEYIDETGTDHDSFGFGLKKSLLNFMHHNCLDYPLSKWFDFKVPKTSINSTYIQTCLSDTNFSSNKPSSKVIYLGNTPTLETLTKSKKGAQWEVASITFQTKKETINISVKPEEGKWFIDMLSKLHINSNKVYTLQEIKDDYEAAQLEDFELFWDNKPINSLYKVGLLHL
jgi:hypothetical protein